jgi:hypothetical protein
MICQIYFIEYIEAFEFHNVDPMVEFVCGML